MARRTLQLAPGLRLPLDAVTHTFGIFGQKGSGKSSTSALFVEQGVRVGGRFVIADPTGVWWGLMHEGIGPGLPGIVFGGEHADVPLERTAGHVVAEFVVQQDEYPVVVLDMKLMRKSDRTTFMLAFMETLYHDNRDALHVVLDESWQFAPTQAREGGETIKLLGAVEDVVALGRARGLGITMISQRMATLNANVREQVGTLIAHRLVGALDRKALKGWIEAQADPAREKEVMEVQAKLKTAEALVWSPAFLDYFGVVKMDAPQTFDSRATPKVGQRVKKPGKRAPVDLNVLRERMAATIEEHEANDPKKLKAKLAQTQASLRSAQENLDAQREFAIAIHEAHGESAVEEVLAVYMEARKHVGFSADVVDEVRALAERDPVPVVSDDDRRLLAKLVEEIEMGHSATAQSYEQLRGILYPLAMNVKNALQERDFPKPRPAVSPRLGTTTRRQPEPSTGRASESIRPVPEAVPERDATGGASNNGSLGTSARHFLTTMARYHPMRMTIGQLGLLAARKTRGGSFNTAMRQLRDGGFVADEGEVVVLTERGMQEAGVTPEEMTLDRWREVLPMASREILDVLVEVGTGQTLTTAEIAQRTGRQPRGGSWNTAVKLLVLSDLVEKSGDGLVLAGWQT